METRWRWAPLPLRLILGIAMMIHGVPKFGAAGHGQMVGNLHGMGVPAPEAAAWLVAAVEAVGGFLLIIGAFVVIVSALMIIEMLVALFKVHLHAGFNFIHITGMGAQGPVFGMPGYEVNLLYIAGLLALLIGGAGALSVDDALRRRRRPPRI